jgi:hypothetical protein
VIGHSEYINSVTLNVLFIYLFEVCLTTLSVADTILEPQENGELSRVELRRSYTRRRDGEGIRYASVLAQSHATPYKGSTSGQPHFGPEDLGSMFLQRAGNYLQVYTALQSHMTTAAISIK